VAHFTIRGNVETSVPAQLSFDARKRGDRRPISFIVRPTGRHATVSVLSSVYDRQYFELRWHPESDGTVQGEIALADEVPYGKFNKEVTLSLEGERGRTHAIQVTGMVEGLIAVKPQLVNFGAVIGDTCIRRQVILEAPYGGRVFVTGSISDHPDVIDIDSSLLGHNQDGQSLWLNLKLPWAADSAIGTIRILATVDGKPGQADIEYVAIRQRTARATPSPN
jgi:hypothetical protein